LSQTQLFCPSCNGQRLRIFYQTRGIPVHCNLLLDHRDEAIHQPRADLELVACEGCGFMFNRAFDESKLSYGEQYEGSQGSSGTFNAFARSLAMRWIERYGVRNKTILEIGSGGGEFLDLICELGDNRGIGIDPAHAPGTTGRVRYIADRYGPRYADLQADFVCCRHTLEHIPQTHDFISTIRQTLGNRHVTVALELPDTSRILREGAFWDVYYEHCSYFTAGSLARLFRGCGFEITHLELDYDDQYLILGAHAGKGAAKSFAIEESPDQTVAAAIEFGPKVEEQCQSWRRRFEQWHGRRIVLWGSGSKGVGFLTTLGLGDDQVRHVVDINPKKQGKFMASTGQRIVAPAELATIQPHVVIVMNPIYEQEIRAELHRQGVDAQLVMVT
jgi:SAM-dependent methyltransferase